MVKQIQESIIKKKRENAGSPLFKKQLTLVFLIWSNLAFLVKRFSLRVFDARRVTKRFISIHACSV